jgi:hypothetical protein
MRSQGWRAPNMNQPPNAWTRCISRFEGLWYIAWWIEGRSTVTLTKTTPMPGDGFLPQEDERSKRLGYMYRKVPACEVEAFPNILYADERVALEEMDPTSERFMVKVRSGLHLFNLQRSAGAVDGWPIVKRAEHPGEWGLVSPYLDPQDPRLELVPGLPFPPGVQPVPKAPATWPPRPPGAAPRRLRFVAQHRGAWCIAVWNEAEAEATLLKSARMPGEGFTPVQGEPARSQGVMERRVPAAEVQPFHTLLYQGCKVQLGAMDREASALRVSLVAPFFAASGEKSIGHASGWRVLDAAAQLVESPYMALTDPRIYALAGLPLVS